MNIVIEKTVASAKKAAVFIAILCALEGVAGAADAQQPTANPTVSPTSAETPPPVPSPAASIASADTEQAVAAPSASAEIRQSVTASPTSAAEKQPSVEAQPASAADDNRNTGGTSSFDRPSLSVSLGEGNNRWTLTLFGFVEADFIYDSTRSYDDGIGNALVARKDTYDGRVGRSQFSVRNSRVGLSFESPTYGGLKGSAVLVGDFFGSQQGYPKAAPEYSTSGSEKAVSESAFFNNPAFRLRDAYLKLENDYVDVLAGQTYDVFGWQNRFFPCSAQFLGLPNQLFSRNAQIQLSHTFGATSPFSIDIAAAAVRPAQRDSAVPDANAGIRLNVNGWKGITTPGNTGTVAQPLSIGLSGTVRQFKVNAFTPPPTQNSNSATGWGLSVDAFLPVIPAAHANDRGNRLTLTGSFVTGTGIGDLITATGGATFPTLPNPAQMNPPPNYHADIDSGLVSFDTKGVVQTIDWWAFRAGLQYYLPPTGRLILSANYTQAHSKNMAKLFPKGGAEIELLVRIADTSQYADLNLFWDATPAIRFGLSGQYTRVVYLDKDKPHNLRAMLQALYAF